MEADPRATGWKGGFGQDVLNAIRAVVQVPCHTMIANHGGPETRSPGELTAYVCNDRKAPNGIILSPDESML